MSKVVEHKGEHFAGTVTFSDPLNLPQEVAFEEANSEYKEVNNRFKFVGSSMMVRSFLPGIFACVEKWDLKGIPANPTIENWPTRPRAPMIELVAWLITEAGKLYADSIEAEAPNA